MCLYCEGDNHKRLNIMDTQDNDAVCIWDNRLLIDDGKDTSRMIYYCPMCGKLLEQGK